MRKGYSKKRALSERSLKIRYQGFYCPPAAGVPLVPAPGAVDNPSSLITSSVISISLSEEYIN